MRTTFCVLLTMLATLFAPQAADARPEGLEWTTAFSPQESTARPGVASRSRRGAAGTQSLSGGYTGGAGPRPRQWCGWYMRTRHGGGPEMNVAWNWRNYGRPAAPQVGAIVVWRHHVGEIVGQAANGQWIVLSGNDGGAVRQRARSIAGAVVRIG